MMVARSSHLCLCGLILWSAACRLGSIAILRAADVKKLGRRHIFCVFFKLCIKPKIKFVASQEGYVHSINYANLSFRKNFSKILLPYFFLLFIY